MEKKEEQLKNALLEFMQVNKNEINIYSLPVVILEFAKSHATKQYHYSTDSVEGLRDKIRLIIEDDNQGCYKEFGCKKKRGLR